MTDARQAAKTVGAGVKKAGAAVGRVFHMVDPDVWKEMACVSMCAYSYLLPRREQIVDYGADGFAPVVLVHGLGGNRGAWWPLRLFLKLQGHQRVYGFGYEKGTVERHAERLSEFIHRVLEVTGEKQVDIVAHSLGGLISRYALQRLGLADSVRTLITLATPHQGTYAARYANTTLTVPLRPDSDLIKDLNAEGLSRLPVRLIAVYSDRDVYVVPAQMMTHPDAENIFIPNTAHSQHLVSPEVFRVVASCLNKVGAEEYPARPVINSPRA